MWKKAFTLLEIMVVIALIWIISFSITKINFNILSDKQRLNWFFYKVKSNIETIENNALIWKAVNIWTTTNPNLIVPNSWKINFSNTGSWKIVSYYKYQNTEHKYNEIIPKDFFQIEIYNNWTLLTDTWTILIKWGNLTLTGITTNNKILKLKIKYKQLEKQLLINSISWVIEEE
jgi:prepilin-type N-terminal cleavage/methylation domain-containing protein